MNEDKVTNKKEEYDEYLRVKSLISRRLRHYTNKYWENFSLYSKTNDSKYKKLYEFYDSRLNRSNLREPILERTTWKSYEREKMIKLLH